jgi:hypothetical protein
VIHVAPVSAYPTEAEGRAAFASPTDAPYHGAWRLPEPYNAVVHVFANEATVADLARAGWTREDA